MPGERVLVNFFYAHPVGHAVEALAFCHGYHRADPSREIELVLNAATAVELAALCPFLGGVHPVEHPFVEPYPSSAARIAGALPYERSLARYFSELSAVVEPASIWSIDEVHRDFV